MADCKVKLKQQTRLVRLVPVGIVGSSTVAPDPNEIEFISADEKSPTFASGPYAILSELDNATVKGSPNANIRVSSKGRFRIGYSSQVSSPITDYLITRSIFFVPDSTPNSPIQILATTATFNLDLLLTIPLDGQMIEYITPGPGVFKVGFWVKHTNRVDPLPVTQATFTLSVVSF